MATKRVCDRCGAEIDPTSSATYVNVRSAFHEKSPDIELCCSCAMQIKEWLKSRVEEGKKDGVYGHWRDNGIAGSMLVKCTVCGFDCGASSFSYCPACGARMDGWMEDADNGE